MPSRLRISYLQQVPQQVGGIELPEPALATIRSFQIRAVALRLITAVALRVTKSWGSRRYLDVSLLDGINPVADAA